MRALSGEVVTGPEARDLRMRALDGREIELTMSSAPLRDREGQLVGAVSVLHDLMERRRLAREAEAARADELAAREVSRRLEEFLATAAHDLRSPLTATLGFLALAERQTERLASAAREACPALAPGVATVRGRVEEADQSARRLSRLLTRLFDTAAIRAGKLELQRAPCDLAALVREQVAALRVAAPGRTITLHVPAGGGPILVEADADRIGQVVANYVTNALKYSPPDRPVDVAVGARGGRARVAARDAGPGLPKEERARVWEPFHRAPGVAAQDGTQGGSLGQGAAHQPGHHHGPRRAGRGHQCGRRGLHLLVHPPPVRSKVRPGRRRILRRCPERHRPEASGSDSTTSTKTALALTRHTRSCCR